jgi:hypothetical protein
LAVSAVFSCSRKTPLRGLRLTGIDSARCRKAQ